MKKRRLFLIFSLMIIFIIIFSLSSPIFRLSRIEISFFSTSLTPTSILDNYFYNSQSKVDEILSTATNSKGELMFFLNKERVKSTLETSQPRLKILSIISIFPNCLRINVCEREDALFIEGKDKFYILDKDYKILSISDEQPHNLIKISFKSEHGSISFFDFFEISHEAFSLGNFLSENNFVFTSMSSLFYILADNVTLQSILIAKDTQNVVDLTLFTSGVTLRIDDILHKFDYKLTKLLSALLTLRDREKIKTTYGTLYIDSSKNIHWTE